MNPPPGTPYDKVLKELNVYIGRLNELANPDLIEGQTGEFVNLIRRWIVARKAALDRGADPDEG
jgi:hypothetical protein